MRRGTGKRVTAVIVVPVVALLIGGAASIAMPDMFGGLNPLHGAEGSTGGRADDGSADDGSADGRKGNGADGKSANREERADGTGTVAPTVSYGYMKAVVGQVEDHWLRKLEFGPSGAKATTYGPEGNTFGYWEFDGRAKLTKGPEARTGRQMRDYGTFDAKLLSPAVLYAAALEAVDLAAKDTDRSNTIGLSAYALDIEYDHDWYGSAQSPKSALITVSVTDRSHKGLPARFAWTVDGKERRAVQS